VSLALARLIAPTDECEATAKLLRGLSVWYRTRQRMDHLPGSAALSQALWPRSPSRARLSDRASPTPDAYRSAPGRSPQGPLVLPAIIPITGRGLVIRKGRMKYVKRALFSGRLIRRRLRQTWGAEHASGRSSTFRRKTLG
jgi:hypothetical protein